MIRAGASEPLRDSVKQTGLGFLPGGGVWAEKGERGTGQDWPDSTWLSQSSFQGEGTHP